LVTRSTERRLGTVIKRRREAAGLSQEVFAELAQLHRTYVSQLERGIKSPSVRVLMKMASALGCEAWEILREAGGSSSPKH
jgi:transcriptional regulator with XRE-family HTH domain